MVSLYAGFKKHLIIRKVTTYYTHKEISATVGKHHTKRLLGQFKYCCSVGMCKSVKEEMLWGNWLVSLCAGFTGHEGEHVNSQFYGQ